MKIKRPRLNNSNANFIKKCTEKEKQKSALTVVKAQPVNEEDEKESERNAG
jgi:hypothetical protein